MQHKNWKIKKKINVKNIFKNLETHFGIDDVQPSAMD